jgi:hypothetical protein
MNGSLPKDTEIAAPPNRSHVSFPPSHSAQKGENREGTDAEFWLLEIRHTGIPAGSSTMSLSASECFTRGEIRILTSYGSMVHRRAERVELG